MKNQDGKAILYTMQEQRGGKSFQVWKSVPLSRMIPAKISDFLTSDKKKKLGMEFWVKTQSGNSFYQHEFNDKMTSESFKAFIKNDMLFLLKHD